MNKKLPFHVPAVGLLSAFLPQIAQAADLTPQVTFTTPSVTPQNALVDADGAAVLVNGGQYVVLPDQINTPITVRTLGKEFTFKAGAKRDNVMSTVQSFLAKNPGAANNVTVQVVKVDNVKPTLQFTKATPAALSAPGVQAAAIGVNFRDPSPVTATVSDALVGSKFNSGTISGLVIGPDNSLQATAIGSTQTVAQTLAAGETSVAAALLDNTVIKSTTTATLQNSNVGVVANGTLSGTGGILVEGNSAGATARANDSSATTTASGAGSGESGISEIPTIGTRPADASTVTIKGDAIAAGMQILDSESHVSATTTNTDIGVVTKSFTIDGLPGGISVQDNALATTASGNRLGLQLTSDLAGGKVGSTAYALQTAQDSNVSASTQGSDVGLMLDFTSMRPTQVLVDSNTQSSSATANSATTIANVKLGDAGSALAMGSDQYLSANNQNVKVTADLGGSRVGTYQGFGTVSNNSVTDNRLASSAVGNDQQQSLQLQGALVSAAVPVKAAQSIDAGTRTIDITASVGLDAIGSAAPVLLGTHLNNNIGDSGNSVLVSGNALSAQASGNRGAQSLTDISGQVSKGIGLEQAQTASGAASVQSTLANAKLGMSGSSTSNDTRVAVENNTLSSVAQVNGQQQAIGRLLGSVSDTVSTSATQTVDGASATAKASSLDLGIQYASSFLSLSGSSAVVSVDGNRIGASAGLNSATQAVGTADGNISGTLASSATQTVAGNNATASASAQVSDVALGVSTPSLVVRASDSFNLSSDRNVVTAAAQANRLDRTVGDLSGQVGSITQSATQMSDAATVTATVERVTVGIQIDPNSSSIYSRQTNIGASDNSVQASAQQNRYTSTVGQLSGVVGMGGGINSSLDQSVTGGETTAKLDTLTFGTTTSLGESSNTNSNLIVDGNNTRADAAGNIASIALGGVNGAVNSGPGVGATLTQSTLEGSYSAQSNNLVFGLSNRAGSLTFSPALFDVTSNRAVTASFGNAAELSLGELSGDITASGGTGFILAQQMDSTVSSQAKGAVFGASTGNSRFDGARQATAPVNVNRNALVTAATGNSSSVDLGAFDGSLKNGVPRSQVTQQFGTASGSQAGVSASTSGVVVGASATEIAVQTTMPASISNNTVSTSAVANSHSATADFSGAITASPQLIETQTTVLNAAGNGVSASTSGVSVGIKAENELGSNLQAAVNGNTVSASVAGNSLSDAISVSGVPLQGAINQTGQQSLTGAGANAKLSASLSKIDIGVVGGSRSSGVTVTSPVGTSVSVSDNQLLASSMGNTVTRAVDASGVLNGQSGGNPQVLTLNDRQSILNGYVTASIDTASIGGQFGGTSQLPLNVSTANNQVIAQAVGNSVQQRVSLDGAIATARPATSLTANQSLIGTTVTATLTGITVGAGNPSANPLQFQGAAVTSGNTVGATAIGNTTQLIRQ